MKRSAVFATIAAAALAAAACTGSPEPAAQAAAECTPARVDYSSYPGSGHGLDKLPWIRGELPDTGLVGLLWYWPENWSRARVAEARIFTGGTAPGGFSAKILWVFTGDSERDRGGSELVVRGRRLDGSGSFQAEFAAISYAGQKGAPSYASIVDVPTPGCWRLNLTTGDLSARVDLRAVRG